MISILFLAADPTDISRLRLGEEAREIQEKLQLSRERDNFLLHQRLSVRPVDISQALLDINPQIVHFSGHGTEFGALCVENSAGHVHPVDSDTLGELFSNFASHVNCVILNACFSSVQASSISKHIPYVIGMNKAIGDKAAIAFSIGFYQSLGAGRTIEDSYRLGCVQIGLHGISESRTPTLLKRKDNSLLLHVDDSEHEKISFRKKQDSSPVYLPISQLRKHLVITGMTGSGRTNTLNWITATLWENYSIPFLAIRHWHGLSKVSPKVLDKISYHSFQNSRFWTQETDKKNSADEITIESKVDLWLQSVQEFISIDYLLEHPTIIDIPQKGASEVFVAIFERVLESVDYSFQTDQLRLVIVIDELDSIFDGAEFSRWEMTKNLLILRNCGVGVFFTCNRISYTNEEVRNLIVHAQCGHGYHQGMGKFGELQGTENLWKSINSPGEAILSSRGCVSPVIVSIPDSSAELCTFQERWENY
jgi:hypothetical protein